MPSTTRGNVFMIFLFVMIIMVQLFLVTTFRTMHYGSLLVLSQFGQFGLTFLFYLIVTKQNPLQVLPFAPLSFVNGLYIVAISIFIQPIMMLLSVLVSFFAPNEVSDIAQGFSSLPFWVTLLILAVTPSIFEEITFRGVVLHEYQHAPKKVIIVLNGLFFGLMHMNWNQFVYATLLGMVFSYFVLSTKTILSSMLGHFVINGGQAVLVYVPKWLSKISPEAATTDIAMSASDVVRIQLTVFGIIGITVAPIIWFLLRGFYHYNKKRAFPLEIPETVTTDCLITSNEMDSENIQNKNPRWFLFTLIIVVVLYTSMATYLLLRPV